MARKLPVPATSELSFEQANALLEPPKLDPLPQAQAPRTQNMSLPRANALAAGPVTPAAPPAPIPVGQATDLSPKVQAYGDEVQRRAAALREASAARAAALPKPPGAVVAAPGYGTAVPAEQVTKVGGLRGAAAKAGNTVMKYGRMAGQGAGALGILAGGAQAIDTIARTPTSDYQKRFGMTEPIADGLTGLAQEYGIRLRGGLSDVADLATGGWLGRSFYPDKQSTVSAAIPPNMTAPSAGPNVSNEVFARTGVRPSGLRGGRGSEYQINPGADLTGQPIVENAVYKTRGPDGQVSYSGRNVRENAPIVEGYGRKTGDLPPLNNLSTSEGLMREMRAADIYSSAAEAQPRGGISGFANPSQKFNDEFNSDMVRNRLDSSARLGGVRERAAAVNAMQSLDNAQTQAETERARTGALERNAKVAADASVTGERIRGEYGLRSATITAGAQRRAGDLKFMQDQLDRRTIARAWERSGGNREATAALLEQEGLPDEAAKVRNGTATIQNTTNSAAEATRRTQADSERLFRAYYVKQTPNGEAFDEVGAARAAAFMRRLTDGKQGDLDPTQVARYEKQAIMLSNIAGRINEDKPYGVVDSAARAVGLNKRQTYNTLPELKGGKVRTVGVAGFFLPNAASGDVVLTLPNGRDVNLGQITDQDERKALEELVKNGVGR